MTFKKPHAQYKCGACQHIAKGKNWLDEEWWCEDCRDDHQHDVCPNCGVADRAERVKLGRTADAMSDAKQNAIYVWLNSRLGYPRDLAKFLDRGDLQIVSLSELERMRPDRNKQLNIDHACRPTFEQLRAINLWQDVNYRY